MIWSDQWKENGFIHGPNQVHLEFVAFVSHSQHTYSNVSLFLCLFGYECENELELNANIFMHFSTFTGTPEIHQTWIVFISRTIATNAKKKHLHTLQWRKRKLKLNWFGWKSTVFVCWLFQDILFRPYEMLCNWIVIEQLLLSMQAAAAQSQIQTTYTNVQRQQMKRTIRMIRNERVVLPIENHERVSSGDSKRRKSKWKKMNYSLWCWTFETIVSFDYIDFFLFPSCSIQLEFQTNVWVW